MSKRLFSWVGAICTPPHDLGGIKKPMTNRVKGLKLHKKKNGSENSTGSGYITLVKCALK